MTEQFTSQPDRLRASKARQNFGPGLAPIDASLVLRAARRVFHCHAAPEQLALEAAERYLGEKIRTGRSASSGRPLRPREATVSAWVDFLCFSEHALAPNRALQAMLATFSESEIVSLTVAIGVISRDAFVAAEWDQTRRTLAARDAPSI